MMKEIRREDVILDLVWLRLMNAFLSISPLFLVFSHILVMMTFNVILLSCSFRAACVSEKARAVRWARAVALLG